MIIINSLKRYSTKFSFLYRDLQKSRTPYLFWNRSSPVAAMSTIPSSPSKTFSLSDYDCVGFDLDNTLVRYKLLNQVEMEYDNIVKYLVEQKGYDARLKKPLKNHMEFLRKGLFMDLHRGNLLQLSSDGSIQKGSHGTKMLTEKEICDIYGNDLKWDAVQGIVQNLVEVHTKPSMENVRMFADYFDIPSSLVSMRIVDLLDEKNGNKPLPFYNYWPDVLEALMNMYNPMNYKTGQSAYFNAITSDPDKYVKKRSESFVNWLKELKKEKTTFLITGSFVDYGSFVASHGVGKDWKELFDICVYNARKPGFFDTSNSESRPFYKIDGTKIQDDKRILGKDLQRYGNYFQGNWGDLYEFFKLRTNKPNPRCVYFGDHITQDVYAPSVYAQCDTVAVFEEAGAESSVNSFPDRDLISSSVWGSIFHHPTASNTHLNTLIGSAIQKNSELCIADVANVAVYPINHRFKSFRSGGYDAFLPSKPQCL